jgi:peptidoglycan/LPS O-acetylase OafA/YrhL
MYFIIIENKSLFEVSGKSLLIFSICILGQLLVGKSVFLPNYILFTIGFLVFAIAISRYKNILFVNPIIIYIGKISFSIYLTHFAILSLLSKFNFIDYVNTGILNYIIRFCIVVCIAIILSTITYHFIEVPFQNIGKRIIKKYHNTI